MLGELSQRRHDDRGGECYVYLLQVVLHLWILHLCDPAIVSELHSDDCNTIKLVNIVKLLVAPPLVWYQPLGTYRRQSLNQQQRWNQLQRVTGPDSAPNAQHTNTNVTTWSVGMPGSQSCICFGCPFNFDTSTRVLLSHACNALHLAAQHGRKAGEVQQLLTKAGVS